LDWKQHYWNLFKKYLNLDKFKLNYVNSLNENKFNIINLILFNEIIEIKNAKIVLDLKKYMWIRKIRK